MADDHNEANSLDLFTPPSEVQATIDLARRIKENAEKLARQRDDAIAAMPPPQRIDTYVYERSIES